MLVMICCVENSESFDVYQKVAVHGALEAYDENVPTSLSIIRRQKRKIWGKKCSNF
jgi:hypothetical protein